VRLRDLERYWDARARENALFFVDSRLDYRSPDEEAFWRGGEEAVDLILDAVGVRIKPHEVVVDIGCGVGRLTRSIAARAAHVIAIDVSGEMIASARRWNAHLENVEWVHGDGQSLQPIADASVHGCFSHVVFQHLLDQEITLGYVSEMGWVVRPGGWGAFIVSTDPLVHRRPSAGVRLKALLHAGPKGAANPAWRGSAVTVEGLQEAAAAGGRTIERLLQPGSQFTTVLVRRRPVAG